MTVSKIFILSPAEVLPTLQSFIPTANIPKKYGGELDFSWNDQPRLDDTIRAAVTWQNGHTAFPEGPLYWVPVDGGERLECVARGTVDKKERNEVVGSIAVAVAPEVAQETVTETVAEAASATNGGVATEPLNGADATGVVAAAAPVPSPAPAEEQQKTLAVNETALPEVSSPASEKFVDAPEVPLASPVPASEEVVVDEVQKLSLGEGVASEKVPENGEAIPNGKAVTTA